MILRSRGLDSQPVTTRQRLLRRFDNQALAAAGIGESHYFSPELEGAVRRPPKPQPEPLELYPSGQ